MLFNDENNDGEFTENHPNKRQRLSLDDNLNHEMVSHDFYPLLGEELAIFNPNISMSFGNSTYLEIPNHGESKYLSHTLHPSLQNMPLYPFLEDENTPESSITHQKPQTYPENTEKNVYPSPPLQSLGLTPDDVRSNPPFAVMNHQSQGDPDYKQLNILNSNENLHQPKNNSSQNAEQKYMRFVPSLRDINGNNFKDLLVEVLRECPDQVPLDDFYNLVYSSKTPDQVVSSPIDGLKIDKFEDTDSRLEGLHLCYLILETFRLANFCTRFGFPQTKNLPLISVDSQDICKMFLAIKIVFDSVKVVEDSSRSDSSLSRSSIYKAYYIICKKLIQKYPLSRDFAEVRILSQSQLGKIIKLNFPKLGVSRFGKRGESTYHYRGVIWNKLVIDEEIKHLVELSLPDIESTFESSQDKRNKRTKKSQLKSSSRNNILTPNSEPSKQILRLKLSTRKAVYSFVNLSSTLPTAKCFPRAWQSVPGQTPKQSQWSKETMKKSVEVLKSSNIDLEPLVFKLTSVFSAEALDSFLEDVILTIHFLNEVSALDELYLHLYLIVSTLVFPIVFSSEKEVPIRDKIQLRTSLSNFATRLESGFVNPSQHNNLMAFASIIQKMINFNNLILSHYKTSSIKSIVKMMVGDAQMDPSSGEVSTQDIILRQALMACNAFNWDFIDENLKNDPKYQVMIIEKITSTYMKLALVGAQGVMHIPESMTDEDWENSTYDLLYYIFEVMLKAFHEIFLSETYILQLPVKLIDFFLVSITKEFQNLSFRDFAKREKELSKDLFRAWWVHLSAVQVYLNTISEISALSVRLF